MVRRKYQKRGRKRTSKRMATRVPRSMPRTNSTMIQRTTFIETWSFNSVSIGGFWRYYTVAMSQMNNWAEFKPVFDQYKINALKFTFRPRYDSYEGANPVSPGLPLAYAHVIKDPASTNIPSGTYSLATVNSFLENGNVKTYPLNKSFSVYYRPKVNVQIFGGGTASSVKSSCFIKSTDDLVDHRGFHIFLQNNNLTGTNSSVQLDVFCTFYISLKDLR